MYRFWILDFGFWIRFYSRNGFALTSLGAHRHKPPGTLAASLRSKIQDPGTLWVTKMAAVLVCALIFTVAFPTTVGAQTPPQVYINQVNTDGWPEVTLNLSLTTPDGKAIPGAAIQQFQVLEQGKV